MRTRCLILAAFAPLAALLAAPALDSGRTRHDLGCSGGAASQSLLASMLGRAATRVNQPWRVASFGSMAWPTLAANSAKA